MRRTLIGALLLAILSVSVALAVNAASRDRVYARLIAEGDAAVAGDQPRVAIEAYSGAIALKSATMLAYLKRGETYRRGDTARREDLREASARSRPPRALELTETSMAHSSGTRGPSKATRPTSNSTRTLPGSSTSSPWPAIGLA
jgi:hypothetical protein